MNTRILREVPEKRERYVKHFQMKEKERQQLCMLYQCIMKRMETGRRLIIDWKVLFREEKGFIRTKHPEFMYVLRSRQEMKS